MPLILVDCRRAIRCGRDRRHVENRLMRIAEAGRETDAKPWGRRRLPAGRAFGGALLSENATSRQQAEAEKHNRLMAHRVGCYQRIRQGGDCTRIIRAPMRPSHSLPRTCALVGLTLLAGTAGPSKPLVAAPGDAQVTPGEFVVEHPTLINLGFEWHIDGDANRNASVDVSFRKQVKTAVSWASVVAGASHNGASVDRRPLIRPIVCLEKDLKSRIGDIAVAQDSCSKATSWRRARPSAPAAVVPERPWLRRHGRRLRRTSTASSNAGTASSGSASSSSQTATRA